jgi:hypothetical protein
MNEVNIIYDILKAMLQAQPGSVFINSLHQQYCERGGLSKKQLEGLHSKASKIEGISSSKLATLQAIINKRPTRYKSEVLIKPAAETKDETTGKILEAILEKYPQHKRVLFLQSKYNNNEVLAPAEITEIQKFGKLLL